MAQLEFGGVKFTGGKMVAVFTALSTLGGALWGGFEVYSRYQSMEKKIASYTAPDLSGFDKRLLVLETKVDEELRLVREEMTVLQERVNEVYEISRDIRTDTRSDAAALHTSMSDLEKRSRQMDSEARAAMRVSEKAIRQIISSAQERFDSKIVSIDEKLDNLEKRMRKQVRDALDNPILKGK